MIGGFISIADNLDDWRYETLENRLIIKANSDTFASTREISQEIANMSAIGNEDWKMKKVTLPITYDRYHETLKKRKKSKHSYTFRMLQVEYQAKSSEIAKCTNNHNYPYMSLIFENLTHEQNPPNLTPKNMNKFLPLISNFLKIWFIWLYEKIDSCKKFCPTPDSRKFRCNRGGLFFTLRLL